jgi:hypothetical protein
VNRHFTPEAYARMRHSSTKIAGYTVEYVGVSMKKNGHLVEMGACVLQRPTYASLRVHAMQQDGSGLRSGPSVPRAADLTA